MQWAYCYQTCLILFYSALIMLIRWTLVFKMAFCIILHYVKSNLFCFFLSEKKQIKCKYSLWNDPSLRFSFLCDSLEELFFYCIFFPGSVWMTITFLCIMEMWFQVSLTRRNVTWKKESDFWLLSGISLIESRKPIPTPSHENLGFQFNRQWAWDYCLLARFVVMRFPFGFEIAVILFWRLRSFKHK